ncbi:MULTISPECIES: phosphopantetheine-binding protein [unclassified Pseudomonas]|uniref:phosphopantetheine-binding protein n=1 Tax=unclassified Pseudomonas TaxID=196821 RepID=UPI002AC907C6|nr:MULTISPECIES: phosphopantetheine-binding protein [unclassified Pseudomonas]MEB0046167.1 phosphopantetheine-binding protein [Pseudomonas sp. Dout3]MEB0097427.1 phosphopantetheine-binding protein [Pseudomonas sp. DC1.2]WPX61693.1 phosphopantetheine-binding protein [Pseudomonas sp. DC1.2]
MYLVKIKEIAADILFLDGPESIPSDQSFDQIGFTSIDFIDFCFEVKSQINPDVEPEYLWPFHKMMADPALCVDSQWTVRGREMARDILQVADSDVVEPNKIGRFWTPEFCSRRLEALAHG